MQFARIPWISKLVYGDALFRITEPNKKAVYLTFDDGPVPEATPLVLDILAKHNVKATFFCVGENVKRNPEIYQRILNEGHGVGNHSYNHLNGWKTNDKEYFENVEECAKVLDSKLFRPPYGRMKYSQYKELKKKYKVVMWDLLSYDYDAKLSAETCLVMVRKNIRSGSIIVFHDSVKASLKIPVLLNGTLELIKQKGFEAATIKPL
jgi:peptidoglycan/xylan/chitin deacetylase (PgdA/CDA1 family)